MLSPKRTLHRKQMKGRMKGVASRGNYIAFGEFDGALTLTHTGFCRVTGNRLIGEDADPHAATALDLTSHGDTSSFDLASGEPALFKSLDTEFAKGDIVATRGDALHAPFHLLTM